MPDIAPGDIVWVDPGPAIGREQRGRRPALVVSGDRYLSTVITLAYVVPLTSVDRGWVNHVRVEDRALPAASWAMTEQMRAISRDRIVGHVGRVTDTVLARVRVWLADFLEL